MQTTKKFYKNVLYLYGILTVLIICEHFEKEENFEECIKIIRAIEEKEKYLNAKLGTKITKELIDEVIKAYNNFGLSGELAVERSTYYASLVIKIINE